MSKWQNISSDSFHFFSRWGFISARRSLNFDIVKDSVPFFVCHPWIKPRKIRAKARFNGIRWLYCVHFQIRKFRLLRDETCQKVLPHLVRGFARDLLRHMNNIDTKILESRLPVFSSVSTSSRNPYETRYIVVVKKA